MGLLTAMEIAPFVLFSLPVGRLARPRAQAAGLHRRRVALALIVASVPLAWWLGWLSMAWLYVVGFAIGTVYTIAGSAAQIVLTQIVAARAAGRGACQERAGQFGCRGRRARLGRRC